MVEFSSYTTPMDRDYGKPDVDEPSTNDAGIGVADIGQSVPMGIAAQNVQGIGAKIKAGAGNLEIGFAGTGRGQRGAQTPGQFGDDQRQALRELAEVNEVNLTTHAAYGIMGMAGMDPQSGNFSKEHRKMAVDEIKRAVEFAADAALGGSVVVHTGEFQRPMSEEPWAIDPRTGKHMFKAHEEESELATVRVVDDRTGQVQQVVRKNQLVPRPIWNRNEDGEYINYEGEVVDMDHRVPEFDAGSGRFKVDMKGWNYFEDEAKELNKIKARGMGITLEELKMRRPNDYVKPEEAFLKATLEANEGHARGWALQYAGGFDEERKSLEKLKKAIEFYEKLENATPEDEKWKLMRAHGDRISQMTGGVIPPENKLPSEALKETLKETRTRMEYEHEASVSQEQIAAQTKDAKAHIMAADKYALTESFRSYAESGLFAYDQTKQKHLSNPLVVTMENIFPESYGGHPDELMHLIEGGRKKMAEMLQQQRGISASEAKKYAETHIKATLDTGHLNLWRKYWEKDPHKTIQQNDSDFNRWMLGKVEELAKKHMVGNVHLVDNYGYQDDHLAPGQGNCPVKDMVYILKRHGYKGALTVEPGADASTDLSDFHGLMKTWKLFGSPVYGAHGPVARTDTPRDSWGDIQYSYFGQGASPYYVFGPYSPSQDWTLWSQTPME